MLLPCFEGPKEDWFCQLGHTRKIKNLLTYLLTPTYCYLFPKTCLKHPAAQKQLPTSYHSCIALDRYPRRIIRTYIYQSLECIEPQSYIYLRNHHFFYLGITHIRIYPESLTSILRKYIQHLIYAYPQKSPHPNTNVKI